MQNNAKKLDHLVSVRGLAAWLVVLFHSVTLWYSALPQTPMSIIRSIEQGYLAVDFFFVLSGFIIFINYYGKFDANFRHNLLTFYWNRLTRIYPVHLLMLGAYAALCGAFLYASKSRTLPDGYTFTEFWQSLLLIHAWTDTPLSLNVPSWSISAEWFVYLLFPFIAALFRRQMRGLASHLVSVLAMLVLTYAVYAWLGAGSLGSMEAGMPLIRVVFEFTLGALAGSLYIYHAVFLLQWRTVMAIAITALAAVTAVIDTPNYATVPALFFLSVIYLVTDKGRLAKILSQRCLVYLGEISYSTYLVHYFVYDVFKAGWVHHGKPVSVVALLLSFLVVLLISMLMYRFVEMPAQAYLRSGFGSKRVGAIRFRP